MLRMLMFSAIVWNAQAAKVCQAADNCDITMVAALRLSDMSTQHVDHQGARRAASRGVYFRSSQFCMVSCLEARWRVRAIAHLKNLRSEALLIIFYWMKGVISEIKRSMI